MLRSPTLRAALSPCLLAAWGVACAPADPGDLTAPVTPSTTSQPAVEDDPTPSSAGPASSDDAPSGSASSDAVVPPILADRVLQTLEDQPLTLTLAAETHGAPPAGGSRRPPATAPCRGRCPP